MSPLLIDGGFVARRSRHTNGRRARWVLGLALLLMPPGCPSSNDAEDLLPFDFVYKVDYGLDCYQVRDCGVEFRVYSDGLIERLDDKGVLTTTGEAQLDEQTAARIVGLFDEVAFDSLPSRLPRNPTTAGGTTVSISVAGVTTRDDAAAAPTRTVVASMDQPELFAGPAFPLFEQELRALLERLAPGVRDKNNRQIEVIPIPIPDSVDGQ